MVAGGVALALVVHMAWDAGGYFPSSHVQAGAAAFVSLGLLLALWQPHYQLSGSALIGLGALAGLTAWTGLSVTWSAAPDAAAEATQLDLLYVGLFALGLIAAGSGRYSRHLVWAVLATLLVVAGAALMSRILPDVVAGTPDVPKLTSYRLSYPLGYWNALGALAATGTVLALGLSADPRSSVALRASGAGAAIVLFVAMYLTFSRGAWLALIAGLVVLVAMGANRGSLLVTGAIVGPAGVLAVVRLQSYPALTGDPSRDGGRVAAGHAYTPQLVILVVVAALLVGVVAAGRQSDELMRAMRKVLRPLAVGVAIALALFGIVAYGLRAGRLEGWSAERVHSASNFLDREWQEFLRPTTFSTGGTARLTTAKGTRSDLYRVAFDGFEHDPLRGDGAGSFQYRWARERRVDELVRNAHSLEFETLSELGLVGGLLLVAFLGSILVAAVRSRARAGALPRSQSAAVAAACTVWVVHSFVDWDWQMPAYTGAVLVLAASLFPLGRRRVRETASGEPPTMRT
jgi:O-antigen ligase